MTDNAILGFEAMHKIKNQKLGKLGLFAFKLDMSKAYDRVEWVFLREIMLKMGFENEWVTKIMNCVSSAPFSTIINGHPTGLTSPQRERRQGCPLSTYLFLFYTKGLTGLHNRVEHYGHIQGLKINRHAPPITHLLFADDCLIFTGAKTTKTAHLQHILKLYEDVLGQCINFQKSKIAFSPNTPITPKNTIRNSMGLELVYCYEKYLGLPAAISKNRKSVFEVIKESSKKSGGLERAILFGWGNEVLMKAVA